MAAHNDDGPTAVAAHVDVHSSPVPDEVAVTASDQTRTAAASGPKRIVIFKPLPRLTLRGRSRQDSHESETKKTYLPAASAEQNDQQQQQEQFDQVRPLQHQQPVAAGNKTSSLSTDMPTKFAVEDDVGVKDESGAGVVIPDAVNDDQSSAAGSSSTADKKSRHQPEENRNKDVRKLGLLKRIRVLLTSRMGRMDKDGSTKETDSGRVVVAGEDNATNSNTHIVIDSRHQAASELIVPSQAGHSESEGKNFEERDTAQDTAHEITASKADSGEVTSQQAPRTAADERMHDENEDALQGVAADERETEERKISRKLASSHAHNVTTSGHDSFRPTVFAVDETKAQIVDTTVEASDRS